MDNKANYANVAIVASAIEVATNAIAQVAGEEVASRPLDQIADDVAARLNAKLAPEARV